MTALLLLILPLCLDTFVVSAALGIARVDRRSRALFSVVMASFEGGMPLVGLLIGSALSDRLGQLGEYLAVPALAAVGVYMLRGDEERARPLVASLLTARGLGLVLIGLTVSIDELAIGFVLGLLDVPALPAVLAIAAQAVVATQLGFALGAKIGARSLESAERLAGVALIALAAVFLVDRLLSP